MNEAFHGEAVRLKRGLRAVAIAFLPGAPAIFFAGCSASSSTSIAIVALGVVTTLVGVWIPYNLDPWPRRVAVDVEASAHFLKIEGLSLPRESLYAAEISGSGSDTRLLIHRSSEDAPIVLVLAERDARRLVGALGLEASPPIRFAAASLVLRGPALPITLLVAATAASMLVASRGSSISESELGEGVAASFAPLGLYVLMSFVPSTLRLTRGGIEVSWLGRRRFYPCREIAGVRSYSWGDRISYEGIALKLTNDATVRLPIASAGQSSRRIAKIIELIRHPENVAAEHARVGDIFRATMTNRPEMKARIASRARRPPGVSRNLRR